MKKTILIAVFGVFFMNVFAQTFKLETVFGNKASETYLSHWKLLENKKINHSDIFSLWGYQLYFDSWEEGAYEVEYYKGNAKETYSFLNQIIEFTKKYREEDKVVTYISGVQVKTFKVLNFRYTLVYDKERKVVCKFNLKQWSAMLEKFVVYCQHENIVYQ